MNTFNPPPKFEDDLADFAQQLRQRAFRTQNEAAEYCCISRPNISRYESYDPGNFVYPPLEYFAALACYIVDQIEDLKIAEDYKETLLDAINTIRRNHNPPRQKYKDIDHIESWEVLKAQADSYRDENCRTDRKESHTQETGKTSSAHEADNQAARDLLNACQAQVESVLDSIRHKYVPELYVNRRIERNLNEFFDTPNQGSVPNCYLLVAPAGSGKTSLLCNLANTRIKEKRQLTILLMGGSISSDRTTSLLSVIQEELEETATGITFNNAGDCLKKLNNAAKQTGQDMLIILDAINEYDRPIQMRKAIEDLFRKTRGKHIKLVVTCRDYYWELFKGDFWQGATVNDLPNEVNETNEDDNNVVEDFSNFAADEYELALGQYLKHYRITAQLGEKAAERCHHPLLLLFFCEAYKGQDVGQIEDIRLKELFDEYWDQKLISIAERMVNQNTLRLQRGLAAEVGNYLLDVAAYMLHHNVRDIPLAEISKATGREEQYDDPHSIYGRIRDEFIILEAKEQGQRLRKMLQIAFVYEEFMEYVMARSLVQDWNKSKLNETQVLAEIERLTGKYDHFAQIIGVMVYLAIMLKEERNLALWSLLVKQGERWQKVVFEAISKLPEDHLDVGVFNAMEEMLALENKHIQEQVLDTLKKSRVGQAAPESTIELLCNMVKHKKVSIRRRAVLALGNVDMNELALSTLIDTLSDSNVAVRDNAIKSLEKFGVDIVGLLLAALKDPRQKVWVTAVRVLEEMGDDRAVEPLITFLEDTNTAAVRESVARALGRLGDVRAVEPLVLAALKDTNATMRLTVAGALERLGDDRAVELLIAALKDTDDVVRENAAQTLGYMGDDRAVEPLIVALKDTDDVVRENAAHALGQLGDDRAIEPLIAALKDTIFVRWEAAGALGQLGDSRAVDPLIVALKDTHPGVRWKAAGALGQLGDSRAVDPLIAALKDTDIAVRWEAAETLGRLKDTWAAEPFITLIILYIKFVHSRVPWHRTSYYVGKGCLFIVERNIVWRLLGWWVSVQVSIINKLVKKRSYS